MTEPTKLTNAGDSITFTCTSAGVLTGADGTPLGKWPEVEFRGRDGGREVIVRVPQKSADRQLGRIPLTYAECAGKVLTVSRDPNASEPSKPYWGVSLVGTDVPASGGAVGGGTAASPASSQAKPTPAVTAPAPDADTGAALYAKITAYVLRDIVPLYAAKGIPLTMDGTAAIVATLYISATRDR